MIRVGGAERRWLNRREREGEFHSKTKTERRTRERGPKKEKLVSRYESKALDSWKHYSKMRPHKIEEKTRLRVDTSINITFSIAET